MGEMHDSGENGQLEERRLTAEQTYDAALTTMLNRLPEYIIPLVNEAFGKNFTEDFRVKLKNSKGVITQNDGSLRRRESDAYVEISEPTGGKSKSYHFECETWYDRSIAVRIAEYAFVHALGYATAYKSEVVLNYPDSAAICLRPDNRIPGEMKITHRAANGAEMSYKVPVLQVRDYTVDDIFNKKLLILLPFYLFRHVEEFGQMEENASKREEMEGELNVIGRRLEKMAREGKINAYQHRVVLSLLRRISVRLTAGYAKVRKGVDEIMGGYIIRTDADDILEKGIQQGQKELTGLMNFLFTNNRSEDAVRATSDQNYLQELLSQFRSGKLAAK